MKKSKVDLIIIMVPGIYPDEVIKSVKDMNINIEIAKLKDNQIQFIWVVKQSSFDTNFNLWAKKKLQKMKSKERPQLIK